MADRVRGAYAGTSALFRLFDRNIEPSIMSSLLRPTPGYEPVGGISALLPLAGTATVHAASRPAVEGKFIKVRGERFWIKGVTYGTFSPNEEGEPYPAIQQVKDDFRRMQDAGINTVRLYTAPSDRIADAAYDAGLYLIPDICWVMRFCQLDEPARVRLMFDTTTQAARR